MIRTRIAPTPSGYLHIGNAVNFVITWLWARREKGILRLRIDDLDSLRAKQEYIDDIFRTLDWLGIDWDEGPQSPDEHYAQYSQLLRKNRYEEFIANLVKTGEIFACTCGRKAREELNDKQHSCKCREKNISLHQPDTALRVATPQNVTITIPEIQVAPATINLYNEMRDFVIRRRDGIAAYQVASLADDIDFKTNFIVRGTDLLQSTAAQLFLASLVKLNFDETKFYHHPLILDLEGKKLSKSAGTVAIKQTRLSSFSSEKFYRWMSNLLNWPEQASSSEAMLRYANQGLDVFSSKTTFLRSKWMVPDGPVDFAGF